MTERSGAAGPIAIRVDTASLSAAAAAFDRSLTGPVLQSADVLSKAFDRVFKGLEAALNKAARTGEVSIKAMVNAMLADLSRLAFEQFVTKPIIGFIESAAKGLFLGGRAIGGPVQPGGAYLVGERGPELFLPSGMGDVRPLAPNGAPQITIHLHTPDAEGVRRSASQVTAALARAVRRGARGL